MNGSGTPLTTGSLTGVNTDLIMLLVADKGASTNPTATWNGNAMTREIGQPNGTISVHIFRYKVTGATAGSGTISVSWSGTAPSDTAALALVISGMSPGNKVTDVSSTGTSTGPNPGNIGVSVSQQPSMIIAGYASNGPLSDTDGTGPSGFSHLGDDGTSALKLCGYYRFIGSPASYVTGKTGATSRQWAAAASLIQ